MAGPEAGQEAQSDRAELAEKEGPSSIQFKQGPDEAVMMVSVLLVAKRLWNAPVGSPEEASAAQELIAGIRELEGR